MLDGRNINVIYSAPENPLDNKSLQSNNTWEWILRFLEAIPILGCLIALIYHYPVERNSENGERAVISSSVGIAPCLNFWRCFVICFRCAHRNDSVKYRRRFMMKWHEYSAKISDMESCYNDASGRGGENVEKKEMDRNNNNIKKDMKSNDDSADNYNVSKDKEDGGENNSKLSTSYNNTLKNNSNNLNNNKSRAVNGFGNDNTNNTNTFKINANNSNNNDSHTNISLKNTNKNLKDSSVLINKSLNLYSTTSSFAFPVPHWNGNWMASEQVKKKCLYQLTIPGSHNSCASVFPFVGGIRRGWARTQYATVLQQLTMGIRFLDFRLHDVFDHPPWTLCKSTANLSRIWISHTYLTMSFEEALNGIRAFLTNYECSEEIVVLSLKSDVYRLTRPSWTFIWEKLHKFFGDKFVTRSELLNSVGWLREKGKRLVVLVEDSCPIGDLSSSDPHPQLIRSRGAFVDSWFSTNSDLPSNLAETATEWLRQNQIHIHQDGRLFCLKGELTVSPSMVKDAVLYCKLKDPVFLDLADATQAAHWVLMAGLDGAWRNLKLNIVTHDFIRSEIIAILIARNFSSYCSYVKFVNRPWNKKHKIQGIVDIS